MQYSSSVFALAALVSAASAQVFGFDTITAPGKTTGTTSLTGGQDFTIKWEPNTVTGTVTVAYYQGTATNTLQLGGIVKANVTNQDGKVAWTVPSAGFATYGIKITLDSDTTGVTFQWSDPFTITGGSSSSSSSSATGSVTSSSSGSKTSTVTGKTTSSAAPTSANSTTSAASSTITSTSSSLVIKNATTTASSTTAGGASNSSVTLLTTLTPSTTNGGSSGSATSSATKGPSTTGAAVANVASGSIALIGGFMAMAFAL